MDDAGVSHQYICFKNFSGCLPIGLKTAMSDTSLIFFATA